MLTKTKSTLKVRKNGQQKTYNLFCNIAANELNIDVARYKTCLAKIRLFTGLNMDGKTRNIRYSTRLAAMLQNKLHVFVARFSVPSGIRKIFACGIRNPESGKKLESGILGFGILNLSKQIRNPKTTGIQNPSSTIKSRIHSVEASILDCPGFPYAGRDQ